MNGLYDAVLEPKELSGRLHALARSVGAVCTMFYARDARDQFLRLPASTDFIPLLEDFVREGWWARDHRADRGFPLFERADRVALIEEDVASEDDRRQLPQYHDFYPRFDLPWWGGVSFHADGRMWVVPFLRSTSQGPFTREESAHLLRLAAQFERVIGLSKRISQGQGVRRCSTFWR